MSSAPASRSSGTNASIAPSSSAASATEMRSTSLGRAALRKRSSQGNRVGRYDQRTASGLIGSASMRGSWASTCGIATGMTCSSPITAALPNEAPSPGA